MRPTQRQRVNSAGELAKSGESGILDERILLLVFESINWDLHALCSAASVSRKFHAVAKRVLWRQMCMRRAPQLVETLSNGSTSGRFSGGWDALAKLLFFCCGCRGSTRHFRVNQATLGHFTRASRFSKTSGRSFLRKECREDLLYVCDPCEHPMRGKGEGGVGDLGVYRGVFGEFTRSKTRALLVRRRVELEETLKCPYCGARVWSMTNARMIPKSATRRLGCHDGALEYFVCVNGHLYGTCWLVPLSSDEDMNPDDDGDNNNGGGNDDDDDDDHRNNHYRDRAVEDGGLGVGHYLE